MSTGDLAARPAGGTPFVERVSIRNFRGIRRLELELEPDLTVLAGRNNAGKSRVISALQLALGGRPADLDDFTVGSTEEPEVDVVISPAVPGSAAEDSEFEGPFTALFGEQIQPVSETPLAERLAWRTRVVRSAEGTGARAETMFLRFDSRDGSWRAEAQPEALRTRQRRAFAVDFINTGRDLRDELARAGSNVRRVLSDLEIASENRAALEDDMTSLSGRIMGESATLRSIDQELRRLHRSVGSIGAPALSPLPASLEELGRLISIDLDTGSGALPIRFHGAGSRSLSSLQVQRVLYDRRLGRDGQAVAPTPVTLVEEPEAHLHPQASMELPELLTNLAGQKIISTHSPHLVTAVDPAAVRLIQTRGDGVTVIDLGPAKTDNDATHRAFRPLLHTQEMTKIQRLVERPFGELLFASSIVMGDGATERAFLPPALRYAMGHRSHGVAVIDPGSLGGDLANAVAKFAAMASMPCIIYADGDNAGIDAIGVLRETNPKIDVVWINGIGEDGNPNDGAIEAMLLDFDEQMCLEAGRRVRPDMPGDAAKLLKSLKGSSGSALARALIERHPDTRDWPGSLRELFDVLEKVA